MLEINGLVIRYGSVEVVHGVTLHVAERTIVALIGPNGAGKSSVLKSISGLVRPSSGEILFLGARLIGVPPHEIAAAGIAHVLEGRHLFGGLTVEDNLILAGYSKGTHLRWQYGSIIAALAHPGPAPPLLGQLFIRGGAAAFGHRQGSDVPSPIAHA